MVAWCLINLKKEQCILVILCYFDVNFKTSIGQVACHSLLESVMSYNVYLSLLMGKVLVQNLHKELYRKKVSNNHKQEREEKFDNLLEHETALNGSDV